MSKKVGQRRVLLLSPFFYPELISTGKYNTYLVKALIRYGYDVDVVASYPLYPDWKPMNTGDASMEGVCIHRAGQYVRYPRSAVARRLVLEIWFAWHACLNALRLRNNIDIVVSVFPPNIFMLIINPFLPKEVRKVGVIHDLQGIMAKSTQGLLRKVVAKLIKTIEKKALDSCDQLICLSESMREAVVRTYGIDKKKCLVHYPFATLDVKDNDNMAENLADLMPPDYLHVVYSGALGEKQKPKQLLAFLEALSLARDDIMCHLFSRGPMFDALVADATRVGQKTRVKFHDLVPDEMLGALYERSTVQLVPQAEGVGSGAFPSKLPNLLKAGVPVFAISDVDSELGSILRQSRIGMVAHNWDAAYLVREITKFLDTLAGMSRQDCRNLTREYVDKNFCVENLVHSIVKKTD